MRMRPLFPLDRHLTLINGVSLHVTLCAWCVSGGYQTVHAYTRTAANSMAKADRDDALNTLVRIFLSMPRQDRNLNVSQASRLFAAMLDDIVVDVALQSHQEVARSRRKCEVCHTQCVFFPGPYRGSLTVRSLSCLPPNR
jgi:hypothetical protein